MVVRTTALFCFTKMNTETAARPVEGTPLRRKGNSGRSRSGKKVVTASTILAGIDATTPSERTLAHALESTSHSLMTFRERCEQLYIHESLKLIDYCRMKEKEGVSAQMRDQEVDLVSSPSIGVAHCHTAGHDYNNQARQRSKGLGDSQID